MVIVCLARALLAAPFRPSAMGFLLSSQCFGSNDPSSENYESTELNP